MLYEFNAGFCTKFCELEDGDIRKITVEKLHGSSVLQAVESTYKL